MVTSQHVMTEPIPPLIHDYIRVLDENANRRSRLRAIRGLMLWLREREAEEIELAREAGMSWQQIGEAQERPRQVVHRQASQTPRRARVRGLTSPEFEHVGTPDLRYWLKWWSAPERTPSGADEDGRDAHIEQEKLRREIEARERLGVAGPKRSGSW
jgi:hypothetical protein